jgi:hypothetical protein
VAKFFVLATLRDSRFCGKSTLEKTYGRCLLIGTSIASLARFPSVLFSAYLDLRSSSPYTFYHKAFVLTHNPFLVVSVRKRVDEQRKSIHKMLHDSWFGQKETRF